MKLDLLSLITSELLEEFGAGNHKPGSGSAAAFQGMISAKLLITVIELTNDPKRRTHYESPLPVLLKMQSTIRGRIYPQLTKLFEQDSVQFGKTITLRKQRDIELDPIRKNMIARRALDELKVSVYIPLEIADLCIELSDIGEFVFDQGFQSARGDSQVALSGAVAAIAGCLSIIQLNLSLFGSDEYRWIKQVKQQCDLLRISYDRLNPIAHAKMDKLAELVHSKLIFYEQLDALLNKTKSRGDLSNEELENFARTFQILIWRNRHAIWNDDAIITSSRVMRPASIFKKVLGYSYDNTKDLGGDHIDGVWVDFAGVIDQANKVVRISNHTTPQVQNYTAAHELGHALLHTQTILHRDKPSGESYELADRPVEELQADRFASYFLMPRKQVKEKFKELFHTTEFRIDSDTTFKLTGTTARDLRKECKNLRGLCLMLASARTYEGEAISSLATIFKVSETAMAIRLEQLGLVRY